MKKINSSINPTFLPHTRSLDKNQLHTFLKSNPAWGMSKAWRSILLTNLQTMMMSSRFIPRSFVYLPLHNAPFACLSVPFLHAPRQRHASQREWLNIYVLPLEHICVNKCLLHADREFGFWRRLETIMQRLTQHCKLARSHRTSRRLAGLLTTPVLIDRVCVHL